MRRLLCCVMLMGGVMSSGLLKAEDITAICGEWESEVAPTSSTNKTDGERLILIIRSDGILSCLRRLEGSKRPVDDMQMRATFTFAKTNILLHGPRMEDIVLPYSLTDNVLRIRLPDATNSITFRRIRTASELAERLTMQEGMYRFRVTLTENRNKAQLKEVFGADADEYEKVMGKPMDLETFPLVAVGSEYLFPFEEYQFGEPEFDGQTFKVDWAVSAEVCGTFLGHRVNEGKITGNFTSKDQIINGTFVIERIGPLNMNDGVDISMPDGKHFKTGNAFEAGANASPVSDKKVKVDLSAPEKTAKEVIKAFRDRDVNRLWACSSTRSKKEIMLQIGGTEEEAKTQLRNWMFAEEAPEIIDGEIGNRQMTDETHCALPVKWTMKDKGTQNGLPIRLIKEGNEWRLLQLPP